MSTDATPSWSGYIFQGEVALCKAIEKINELGDNIQDSYCLKLEEDEDFSLTTSIWETFQVKAYTIHNYTKYNKAWDDMMRRFPTNAMRNYLYLHKDNVEIDKFNVTLEQARLSTNVFSGIYTLDNIIGKIDNAISILFPEFDTPTIELKRNYCNYKILTAIKERHRTGIAKSFSLIEIKEWILNSDLAFNEEIAWFSIIKKFFEILRRHIESYDEATENHLKEKLTRYYDELDYLQFEDIKILIKNRINSHKFLSKTLTIEDITSYLGQNELNEIIIRCFEEIVTDPSFNNLTYNHNDNNYQLSLINININENSRLPQKTRLHEFCINIENNNLNEVNTIITQTLDLSKEQVNDILRDIMRPNDVIENESDKVNITDKNFKFQFKSVDNSINEINNG